MYVCMSVQYWYCIETVVLVVKHCPRSGIALTLVLRTRLGYKIRKVTMLGIVEITSRIVKMSEIQPCVNEVSVRKFSKVRGRSDLG